MPSSRRSRKKKGEADANVTLADGQAKANQVLAASLSDQILQYQYIQELTDKITVMLLRSGNQAIFDLKSLLRQTGAPTPSATPTPWLSVPGRTEAASIDC